MIMKTIRPEETTDRVEHFYAASRREFLREGTRYALLAGLTALLAVLATRRATGLPVQTCISQGICRGCNAVSDCKLPQALSFRQATLTRRAS